MIRRAFYSKYTMLVGGSGKWSPIKASVDITRYTNATRTETLNESRMAELAEEYFEEWFGGNVRTWNPSHQGFEVDSGYEATMMINSKVHIYVYAEKDSGDIIELVDKVISWK